MWYYLIKVLVSSVIIVVITEVSKRSSLWGGIFASVPLVSVLAFIWLYIDTKNIEKIGQLSYSIFWLVIPSLSLFIILPQLLRLKINFFAALFLAISAMVILYYIMILILQKSGIKI